MTLFKNFRRKFFKMNIRIGGKYEKKLEEYCLLHGLRRDQAKVLHQSACGFWKAEDCTCDPVIRHLDPPRIRVHPKFKFLK